MKINVRKTYLWRRKLLMSFCVGLYAIAFSQNNLTGKVINTDESPIEFAEISLLTKDSVAVKSELSDENGNFVIRMQEGSYILTIRHFKQLLYTRSIDLTGNLNMGSIKLGNVSDIREIVIQGKKKLVERKVDRLIFNVENSVSASGGDALDALKIAPRIKVQNEEISMIGKNGMSVMVDDRLIQLSGTDLTNYLKTIKSDDIKNIEIISNPPAKYNAEGNSGVINIKTKKAAMETWNASLNGTFKQNTYASGSGSGSFSMQKRRFSLNSSVGYINGSSGPRERTVIYYPGIDWTEQNNRKDVMKSLSANIGMEYDLSEKIKMGILYNLVSSRPKIIDRNTTDISKSNSASIDSAFYTQGINSTKREVNRLNYHFIYKIDSAGKKLSVDYDFFSYINNSDRSFSTEKQAGGSVSPYSAALNNGNQSIHNHSVNIDMEHPLSFAVLNYGGRASWINTKNDFMSYSIKDNSHFLDTDQTNAFDYTENTQALYASAQKEFGKKWEAKLGIRLENTQTEGYSATLDKTNTVKYTKLFPTAYVAFKITDNNSLSVNYGKRIERPSYYFLNPFRWIRSPYMYSEGNPFLQPSFTDNIELGYSYKDNYTSTLYYSVLKDGFEQITVVDPATNIQQIVPMNFIFKRTIGTNQSFTFSVFKWWDAGLTGDIYYSSTESNVSTTLKRLKGWSAEFSASNDVKISKNIKLNLTYILATSGVDNLDRYSSLNQLNISLKVLLLEKRLTLSLQGNDLFSGARPRFTSYSNNLKTEYSNYYDQRSFGLSVRYNFKGTPKVQQAESKNKEEFERTN